MSNVSIIMPVIALVAWSLVMWIWMYATRIPAITAAKMELDPHIPQGEQMSTLPANVRWKADNYNHLFEQPTIFYAIALSLAVLDVVDETGVALAWAYVGIRIIHSIFQATTNIILVRFGLFVLSNIPLFGLTVLAGLAVI